MTWDNLLSGFLGAVVTPPGTRSPTWSASESTWESTAGSSEACRGASPSDWSTPRPIPSDAASPMPDGAPNPRYDDPAFRITFARIVTHYFHHKAWLDQDQILRDADRLAGIPAVLIHGRADLGGPLDVPWHLAQAWPDAELVVVDTGHTGGDAMTTATVEATDRLARQRR